MATAKTQALYDVHPGVSTVQKWVAELKGKTGRSPEEWIALVKKEGPKDEKSRREWLKKKHKLGTNRDRKSTRLNSSHITISYAVFCLKKKKNKKNKKQPI